MVILPFQHLASGDRSISVVVITFIGDEIVLFEQLLLMRLQFSSHRADCTAPKAKLVVPIYLFCEFKSNG